MQGIDAVPLVPNMSEPTAGSQQPRLKLHGKTKLTGHMVRPEQDAGAADDSSESRAESFQGKYRPACMAASSCIGKIPSWLTNLSGLLMTGRLVC